MAWKTKYLSLFVNTIDETNEFRIRYALIDLLSNILEMF